MARSCYMNLPNPSPKRSVLTWGILLLCCLVIPTVSAPIGSQSCINRPIWHGIVIFFLTNYISHAATVPSWPGVNTRRDIEWGVLAFLLPYAGITNSCHMIIHYIFHRGDDIGRAIGGKALLVVARKEGWKLYPGEHVYLQRGTSHSERTIGSDYVTYEVARSNHHPVDIKKVNVHGDIHLPPGYELVRPHCEVLEYIRKYELEDSKDFKISRSLSRVKMAVSMAQVVFASLTIYRARGPQIERYGYAAFGLSVFQYAFMSLVNLTCACVVGSYPYAYVLRTEILEEAERRMGARFGGAIGVFKIPKPVSGQRFIQLSKDGRRVILGVEGGDRARSDYATESEPPYYADDTATLLQKLHLIVNPTVNQPKTIPTNDHRTVAILTFLILAPIVVLTPYGFIWALTRFELTSHSTLIQRVAMLAWLGASQFSGLVLCLYGLRSNSRDRFASRNLTSLPLFIQLTLGLSAPAAVLGFVAVFQMLLQEPPRLVCLPT